MNRLFEILGSLFGLMAWLIIVAVIFLWADLAFVLGENGRVLQAAVIVALGLMLLFLAGGINALMD